MSKILGHLTRRTRRVPVGDHVLTVTYTRPDANTPAARHVRALTESLTVGAAGAVRGCASALQLEITCVEAERGPWVAVRFSFVLFDGEHNRARSILLLFDEEGREQVRPFCRHLAPILIFCQQKRQKKSLKRAKALEKSACI